ncbi:UDP-glucuronic acid decarboxylase family protein [Actinosynnema sp. NPDC047251]|uniref:Putative dTDP-glucose 4,6-dehydratase n=1 Tax=Saccharothrix espanaensis (strain ATCC 51144 / DSM 44229 / JCM 9112 / NBRC 15066 / NRRL 15764) TaxID=1179773 RepID=K0JWS5_SACES|nr:UDP-glucuronic acid decarboxylase family protein [Saccharothrix espanaensis]CCH32315.1 putative dTDP-glucose 4,6-dehydratase [Saccharothrix espanaensis DSM 44229]
MGLRRVVVTGGAGFVGSHVCEALLRSGVRVVCVDNFRTGSVDNLPENPKLGVVHADVTRPLDLLGEVDLVLHLACPASPVDYLRMPVDTLRTGALGTLHALELAHRKGARIVVASTSEVYGDPLEHPQREDYWGNVNPIGPRSVYDEAKRFGEAAVEAFRREYGTNTAIVRIFNTYGPRMRPDDGRVIPTFLSQARAGRPLTVHGDGQQTRSLCHVDDLVRGLLLMAESDHHGPINLGNPQEVTVLEIAERIIALTGSASRIEHVDAMVDDPRRRRPDISLARSVLGWQPEISLDEGLRRSFALEPVG